MHHLNREITTKYKNMKLRFAEEQLKTSELTASLTQTKQDLHEYQDRCHLQDFTLKETQAKLKVTIDEKQRLEVSLKETVEIYEKLEKASIQLRQELDEYRTGEVKGQMVE